jgi:hypothetical protein
MIMSRLVKWAAAGVLALGTVPAVGLARTHTASVPGSVSVTPVKAVSHGKKTSSRNKKRTTSRHHKATSKRHATHKKTHARAKSSHSKNTRTAHRSSSHRKTKRA